MLKQFKDIVHIPIGSGAVGSTGTHAVSVVGEGPGAVGGQIVPKPSPGEKVDSKLPVLGQF